jgi:L,D-transpeptidase YbiS
MSVKKTIFILLVVLASIFLILEMIGYYIGLSQKSQWKLDVSGLNLEGKKLKELQVKNTLLQKKLSAIFPRGVYVVVDTGNNILYLKKGTETLRKAVVSCGSGDILEEPGGNRKWVFDTPRGEFFVKSKLVDPDWVRPDWAFIEEGEEIPKRFEDRVDTGVLGDYALGFGNGYFIHGTLYTRLLGRNVTHGCIRVGDEDLKAVFKAISIGSKIFIY